MSGRSRIRPAKACQELRVPRQYGARASCASGGEQGETRREKLFADDFSGESARQIETAGAAGQGELTKRFELGEIEGEAVRMAETAQDAALQG